MPCSLRSALGTMCAMLFSTRSADRDDVDVETERERRGAGAPGAAAPPTRQVEEVGVRLEAPRIARVVDGHRAAEQRRGDVTDQRQVGVDRLEPFRVAEAHLLAGRGQVQIARREAVEADAAAERDVAAAEPRA